jgi:hypothetical protein
MEALNGSEHAERKRDDIFYEQSIVGTLGTKDELSQQANLSYQRRGSKCEDDVIVSDSGRTAVSDALSSVDDSLLQKASQLHNKMSLLTKGTVSYHVETLLGDAVKVPILLSEIFISFD